MKITNDQIYQSYKHGFSLKELDIDRVFNALKANGLQVVLVTDYVGFRRIYNFIPEKNKFYRIH
jgi:hypothetical protein